MTEKIRWSTVIAIAGLVAVAAKMLWDLIAATTDALSINIANDAINYLWPMMEHARFTLSHGQLPLWNPYVAFGTPVAGELGLGMFYPVHWVAFIVDVPLALLLIQLLTVAIAYTGMHAYGRYLRLASPASLLMSCLFAYVVFTESFHPSLGSAICWLPWILKSAHSFAIAPGLRKAVVLALLVALCFLAGFPNFFYYTAVVTATVWLVLSFSSWGQRPAGFYLKQLVLIGASIGLFGGLIAIQLLPGLELSELSVRSLSSGKTYNPDSVWEIFSLGTVWSDMLSSNTAHLYGNSTLQLQAGIYYLGFALALAPFAFVKRDNRITAIALFCALIVLVLFILSYQVSALWLLQEIPLASSLRTNGRAVAYIHGLVVILSGIGLSAISSYLVERDTKKYLGRHGYQLVIWVIAVGILIDVSIQRSNRFVVPAFMAEDDGQLTASLETIRAEVGSPRILFATWNLEKTHRLQNLGARYQAYNIGAYTNLTLARWRNLVRQLAGPEDFDHIIASSIQPRFYGEFTPPLQKLMFKNPRGLDLLSLRYTLFDGARIEDRKTALPRAYTISNYTMASSEQAVLKGISENLAKAGHSVILEGATPNFPSDGDRESVKSQIIDHQGVNKVTITVNQDQPSVLVLTDAFFPGWQAFVDGSAVDILRANSLFRAVPVEAGKHTVDFVYRPKPLYVGFALTLATLTLSCLLLILAARAERKTDSS